jgi:prophage regulatory protein
MANNPQQAARLPAEGFVRIHQVLAVFPISRSGWLAGVKSGKFPKSVKLGPQTTAWKVEDIRALIENFPSVATDHKSAKRAKNGQYVATDLAAQA